MRPTAWLVLINWCTLGLGVGEGLSGGGVDAVRRLGSISGGPLLGDSIQARAQLAHLKQRLAAARAEADEAVAAANVMKLELNKCDSGLEADEQAAHEVSRMVRTEERRVRDAMHQVTEQKALAKKNVQRAKDASVGLEEAKARVNDTKVALEKAMADTKHEMARLSDLRVKRDEATAVAKKEAGMSKDASQVRAIYAVPKIIEQTLLNMEKTMPTKQQAVKDAAANFERAKQVEGMAQAMSDKMGHAAKRSLDEATRANEVASDEQKQAIHTEQTAAEAKVKLMLKKKAEVFERGKMLETESPSTEVHSRLLKEMRKTRAQNTKALNRVEDAAKQLRDADSQDKINRLLRVVEHAKSHERSVKSHEMSVHLAITKARMQTELAQEEHDVDLKEEQEDVASKVASTQSELVKTRILAAHSTISDAQNEMKRFQSHLTDLQNQMVATKSDIVRSALRDRIEKVKSDLYDAKTQAKLAQASVDSGKIEEEIKQDLAESAKAEQAAKRQEHAARKAKESIAEQLETARLSLSGSKMVKPKLYEQVQILSAQRDLEDAKLKMAKHKSTMAGMIKARANLKKNLLTVGHDTRSWAFIEEAQHQAKRASATVVLMKSVAKERRSKVGRLKESLGALNNPTGESHLQKMLQRSELERSTARRTRKQESDERKNERKAQRSELQSQMKSAMAEKESGAQDDLKSARNDVKDLETRLEMAKTKAKPELEAAKAKVAKQTNILKTLKAKYDALPKAGTNATRDEKAKLEKSMAKATTMREIAGEEEHVVSMGIRDYSKRLAKAQVREKKSSQQVETLAKQKAALTKKIDTDRAAAQKLAAETEQAQQAKSVQRKATEVLEKKVLHTDDDAKREELGKLLDNAKGKLDAARKKATEVEQKHEDVRAKEWKEMQTTRLNLAQHKVEMLARHVENSKMTISKLQTEIKETRTVVNNLEIKSADEDEKLLQNSVTTMEGRLKESRTDSQDNKVTDAEAKQTKMLAAEKDRKISQMQKELETEKETLSESKKQLAFAKKAVSETKQTIAAQNDKRSDAIMKVQEAKEKQRAAREKGDLARTQLAKLRHPNGKQELTKKLSTAEQESDAARDEVKRVEAEALKAQLQEKEEQRQKDDLELKMKQNEEKHQAMEKKVHSLETDLLHSKDSEKKKKLKVQIGVTKHDLEILGEDANKLGKSITHLKVEGMAAREERKSLEKSVETFAKEKLVNQKQIDQIQRQLQSNGGLPAAEKLRLMNTLAAAKDKMALSDQKLADSKQQLQSADMRLQRRLAFRGISWRKALLDASKNDHARKSEDLHLLRASLRKDREKVSMNMRIVSHKWGEIAKHLATVKTALESIKAVKGMDKAKEKLQLQIKQLSLDLKLQTEQKVDLQHDMDGYNHRIKAAASEEDLSREQLDHNRKEYHRALILGQSDDKLESKVKDKISFISSEMEIEREKMRLAAMEKDMAAFEIRTIKEPDAEKKLEMKQKQWTMVEKIHDLKDHLNHMKIQAQYKKVLVSCHSEEASVTKQIHMHNQRGHELRRELKKTMSKIMPKHVAAQLDKDAKEAAKGAAKRLAAAKMALDMAKKQDAADSRIKQLNGEFVLAQGEEKKAQLRVAAAAEAGSPATIKNLNAKADELKSKLKHVLSLIQGERKQVDAAQACQRDQQTLIAHQEQKFLKEKLKKQQSTNGNMFDKNHQDAAEKIHELEKAAYQAKFREEALHKKNKAFTSTIGVLMHKLVGATGDKEKKTIRQHVLAVQSKQESTEGALEIASRKRATAQTHQLNQAVRIAKNLSGVKIKQPPPEMPPDDPVSKQAAKLEKMNARAEEKELKQPSAVRSAVLRILAEPSR